MERNIRWRVIVENIPDRDTARELASRIRLRYGEEITSARVDVQGYIVDDNKEK